MREWQQRPAMQGRSRMPRQKLWKRHGNPRGSMVLLKPWLMPPELRENRFLFFEATQSVVLCYGSPSKVIQKKRKKGRQGGREKEKKKKKKVGEGERVGRREKRGEEGREKKLVWISDSKSCLKEQRKIMICESLSSSGKVIELIWPLWRTHGQILTHFLLPRRP